MDWVPAKLASGSFKASYALTHLCIIAPEPGARGTECSCRLQMIRIIRPDFFFKPWQFASRFFWHHLSPSLMFWTVSYSYAGNWQLLRLVCKKRRWWSKSLIALIGALNWFKHLKGCLRKRLVPLFSVKETKTLFRSDVHHQGRRGQTIRKRNWG